MKQIRDWTEQEVQEAVEQKAAREKEVAEYLAEPQAGDNRLHNLMRKGRSYVPGN